MKISRRSVLRYSGLAAAWLALTGCTPTGNASLGSSLPAWMQKVLRVSPADSPAASSAASSEASSEMAASSLPAGEPLDPGFGYDSLTFEVFYVSGGILEVQPTLITLLADTAVRADSLDEAEAAKAKQRVDEARRTHSTNVGYAGVEADLAQSIAQLQKPRKDRGMH